MEAAFLGLIEQYEARLRLLALSLTRNEADAEDLLQEVLVIAYVARRQLRHPSAFFAWVKQIMVRECQRKYRRAARPVDPSCLGQTLTAQEDHSDLSFWSLLQQLPADLAQVVSLRYHADMSQAEVAHFLRVPVGTVKSRLNRALTLLRTELHSEGGGRDAL